MTKKLTRRKLLVWVPPLVVAVSLPHHAEATVAPIPPPFPWVQSVRVIEGNCKPTSSTATSTPPTTIGSIEKFAVVLGHGFIKVSLASLELPPNIRLVSPTLPVLLTEEYEFEMAIETMGGTLVDCSSNIDLKLHLKIFHSDKDGNEQTSGYGHWVRIHLP